MTRVRAWVYSIHDPVNAARQGDLVVVDTNVWVSLTAARATQGDFDRQTQAAGYANFIGLARSSGAQVEHTAINAVELAHVIEDLELAAVNALRESGGEVKLKRKEFRRDPAMRARTADELESAWGQVCQLSQPGQLRLGRESSDEIIASFRVTEADPYDLALARYANRQREAGSWSQVSILSEDQDFLTIDGIHLLTGHRGAIAEARAAERLVTRDSPLPG